MYKAIKAADTELTNKDFEDFANNLDFSPLIDEIKRKTHASKLDFTFNVDTRRDIPIIHFKSNNIVDQCGPLACALESVYVEDFSSRISETKDGTIHFRCGVSFEYTKTDGGFNGILFMSAHYINNRWTFKDE